MRTQENSADASKQDFKYSDDYNHFMKNGYSASATSMERFCLLEKNITAKLEEPRIRKCTAISTLIPTTNNQKSIHRFQIIRSKSVETCKKPNLTKLTRSASTEFERPKTLKRRQGRSCESQMNRTEYALKPKRSKSFDNSLIPKRKPESESVRKGRIETYMKYCRLPPKAPKRKVKDEKQKVTEPLVTLFRGSETVNSTSIQSLKTEKTIEITEENHIRTVKSMQILTEIHEYKPLGRHIGSKDDVS